MNRKALSALLLCTARVAWAAPELVLTRDGQAAATIVLGSSPTRSAQFAAAELQEHVRRISGATLPLVSAGQPVQGLSLLVGESAATRAAGLPGQDLQPQEYLIRNLPNALVLMGRDSPPAETAQGTPGRQPEAGSRLTACDTRRLQDPRRFALQSHRRTPARLRSSSTGGVCPHKR